MICFGWSIEFHLQSPARRGDAVPGAKPVYPPLQNLEPPKTNPHFPLWALGYFFFLPARSKSFFFFRSFLTVKAGVGVNELFEPILSAKKSDYQGGAGGHEGIKPTLTKNQPFKLSPPSKRKKNPPLLILLTRKKIFFSKTQEKGFGSGQGGKEAKSPPSRRGFFQNTFSR